MARGPKDKRSWSEGPLREIFARVGSVFFAGALAIMLITGEGDVEPKVGLIVIARDNEHGP